MYMIRPAKNKKTMTFHYANLRETDAEFVWCVENPTGNIITRFRGDVLITGNCQMLGRGTRPLYAPGFDLETTEGRLAAIINSPKRNCLVLDFAGNTRRLGPINDPVIPKRKGKGGGQAPVRICENCGIYCHASLTHCPECGFEFPRSIKFGFHAGTEALIRDGQEFPQVELFRVDRVVYNEHRKEGRPPSIRATSSTRPSRSSGAAATRVRPPRTLLLTCRW